MMRSEAISIIKRGLGFRQTQDAAIVAALKQAQRDAELGQTLPDWLLVFSAVLTVTPGNGQVPLPTGFLRFHEEFPPYYVNADGVVVSIPRKNRLEAADAYLTVEPGDPQVFVLLNKELIFLMPIPSKVFPLYLTYYGAAAVLDSEMENAWLKWAPNYLIGMAGVHVAGDLRDRAAAEKFNTMARIGQKALIGDIVENELAGRALVMGRNN